jgi:membrane protein YqaA with SNARE-associated domain
MQNVQKVHWIRLLITFAVLIIISIGFSYLLQRLYSSLNIPLYDYAWLAYAVIFVSSILVNLSVIVPVPLAVSIMIAAATKWDPLLVALAGSLGGTIGELSGYYAGYLGKKIAIPESTHFYQMVEGWIQRYGVWAIMFIAFQPIIPFDVGGFIAGSARMPVARFLGALWIGKFPKYVIMIYAGLGLINFLPKGLFGL